MTIEFLSTNKDAPAEGYWDQAFLKDLLEDLPEGDRSVIVLPGAAQDPEKVNEYLKDYHKILLFITSDEEGKFDCSKLSHPDLIHYHQYNVCDKVLPLGYTPQTRPTLKKQGILPKDLGYFYSGQINHPRREQMAKILKGGLDFHPTDGFSKGMKPKEYFKNMAMAKSVPCPPGNLTQDSFRVYEALESGAVPIVDRFPPYGIKEYWASVFPDAPFPILTSYDELLGLIDKCQDQAYVNEVFAWWIFKKNEIKESIKQLTGVSPQAVTVIVPTSPIPSHPSTEIIEQTIASIRHHMDYPIYITIDGLREEQKDRKADYDEYVRRLLWKCNFEWQDVIPVFNKEHVHQSGMMKKVLPFVRTPLLMYVEHDTPLVTDEETDWLLIGEKILSGEAHVVRLHYEAKIPQEHEYLMLHLEGKFLATKQWSQRPHVARTEFYREVMKFFSDQSNCFIEDLLYGRLIENDWNAWKVFIYIPNSINIKRSLNLDGRGKDKKYEREQVW